MLYQMKFILEITVWFDFNIFLDKFVKLVTGWFVINRAYPELE